MSFPLHRLHRHTPAVASNTRSRRSLGAGPGQRRCDPRGEAASMCRHLAELRQAMAAYTAGFDARVHSIDHAAAIEAMAATVKALAAARVAEGPRWREGGQRSAAHELAAATGTSVKDARDTLELGRRLANQPEVSAAARRGELSASQSQLISGAAGVDPAAAGRLLERAGEACLAELKDEAAATRAAGVDLEA